MAAEAVKKVAAAEAAVLNALYASEVTRLTKSAGEVDTKEEGPTPADAQAFKDHKEMISTLENVMAEDKKDGWSPNDAVLD
jgi:hypothetical protein